MAKPKEPEPKRRSKVRAGLPGDDWRRYVSSGAERAYDAPLAPARTEAKALRHKGRLVSAHKAEKRAYKIRVRGYDRKYRGGEPIEKALTYRATKLPGGIARKELQLRLRKKTAAELKNERIKAVAQAVGATRLPLALAAGGTGVAVTDAIRDAKQTAAKKVGLPVKHEQIDETDPTVKKEWTMPYQITAATMVADVQHRPVAKADDVDWSQVGLVEIAKFNFAPIKNLAGSYGRSAQSGFASGGFKGAADNLQRSWGALGGTKGINSAANAAGLTGKNAAIGGGAAAAIGGGLLARRAAKQGMAQASKKAKKYALYGAGGLTGAVAGGTALGNAASGG